MNSDFSPSNSSRPQRRVPLWVFDLLLIVVLAAGLYFRSIGVNWDQGEHLHPDERFLTMVLTSIQPVDSLAQYFNTSQSTLNPHNMGYGFFVYGTLPTTLMRYVGEWLGQTGYDEITLVGRQLSAIADLLTVFLVYLIGARLYDRRVALLATAFSAFAVLQIQLSHFLTVDTFANTFTFLAFYLAVRVMGEGNRQRKRFRQWATVREPAGQPEPTPAARLDPVDPSGSAYAAAGESELGGGVLAAEATLDTRDDASTALLPGWHDIRPNGLYLLFGLAAGMALASKVSTFPVVLLLPLAAIISLFSIPAEERRERYLPILANLALAGLVALLVFRIFQPYAFSGPGFFGIKPNPAWLSNIRELRGQSSVDGDAPFALQWARRPLTFAGYNLTFFGLGLPLGLLAWAGVVLMGWRILKGEWRGHLLLWGWTVGFFVYQSIQPVPSIRYLILIYPTLAMIAAWAVVYAWDAGRRRLAAGRRNGHGLRAGALLVGGLVLTLTFLWAFAFTRIYTRPVTRVAASDWVYQNVPAPINLPVVSETGVRNQPLAYEMGAHISPGHPLRLAFNVPQDGVLMDLTLPAVADETFNPDSKGLQVSVSALEQPNQPLTSAVINDPFSSGGFGSSYTVSWDVPLPVVTGQTLLLTVDIPENGASLYLTGAPMLSYLLPDEGRTVQQMLPVLARRITPAEPLLANYTFHETGTVSEIRFPYLVDQLALPAQKTLRVTLSGPDAVSGEQFSVTSEVSADFLAGSDPRGSDYVFRFPEPVRIKEKDTYTLAIEMTQGDGAVAVYSAWPAIESPWDDPIPLGLHKYNPFDTRSGIYRGDLNFEMYITDSPEKRQRMLNILDEADYIFFSSNRQWGTTSRVPERYPMTTEYYRALLGCPADRDVIWCYNVAQPGMFHGSLGFELVHVSQSEPTLGSMWVNTQFAEEAFTVYDHPKVMVFQKTEDYSAESVREAFEAVDLSMVVHVTPRQASRNYSNLLLPSGRWQIQQLGGTWRELFDTDKLINQSQPAAGVIWYLAVLLLGWLVYPLVRLALPGLSDRGYPLAKTAGLIVLAWLVWMGGSLGISVSRMMITQVIAVLALVCVLAAFFTRDSLVREIRNRGGYYLAVELVALLFFALLLFVRINNPDIWHPAHGGERPMDFSYFNAVLKSSTFPPYDPWWAGGYINYYYYGFVIVGVLVKWLGILPAWAFNLILPTLFSLLGLGVFSVVWNLRVGRKPFWPKPPAPSEPSEAIPDLYEIGESYETNAGATEVYAAAPMTFAEDPQDELDDEFEDEEEESEKPASLGWVVRQSPFLLGLAGAFGMTVLGNLGTLRMIWYGFMRLAAPGGQVDGANLFSKLTWTIQGIAAYVGGADLPYGWGDWYWIPSRAIPSPGGNEITEFPMFTFLYGDLHPHMMALPLTVLVLAWIVSLVLSHGRWGLGPKQRFGGWSLAASFALGGLSIGALRPTNTWDFPTYLVLAVVALAYTAWFHFEPPARLLPGLPLWMRKVAAGAAGAALLVGLALLLYQPFSAWYRQPYNEFGPWDQAKTPFWSYLTHWGLFLFLIASWLFWETRQWLAGTPMSALNRLRPYILWIQAGLVVLVVGVAALLFLEVRVGWLIGLLGVWTAVLLFRPGLSEAKRLVLFLVGTGLVLTLFVELIVLQGDIGRMNTIFKFYLQAWTLFAVAAALGFGWLMDELRSWRPSWLPAWQIAAILLVFSAALFPFYGGKDKIRNRWYPDAPKGLDGMAFMENANYHFVWDPMDLGQDYRAIRWLQENVDGSVVIVEANLRDLYRWGSRMTIYTGLPGVAGWEWHQVQQRGFLAPGMVTNRVLEIEDFYRTTDPEAARRFLEKYNVGYIVVGQQERGLYAGPGLDKFVLQEGILWQKVYEDGQTVIYRSSCSCFPIAEAGR